MKKTKVLLTLTCAVMLIAASVMGTLAYLTDKDDVKNTFTVGQVDIKLDEAQINEVGQPVDEDGKVVTDLAEAERVKKNSYHLLPGHVYTKDPTLTVLKNSEKSYVRLLVTVTFDQELSNEELLKLKLEGIFTGYNKYWVRGEDPEITTLTKAEGGDKYTVITYEYRYKEIVEGEVEGIAADKKLPALFTGITVPSEWDNATMAAVGNFDIDVVGQAIQADGFTTADDAWKAFEDQLN